MSRSVEKDKPKNRTLPEALADEKARYQDTLLMRLSANHRKWVEKKIADIESILKEIEVERGNHAPPIQAGIAPTTGQR